MNWYELFSRWRADYDFKTFANSFASMVVTAVFALYNGYLGLAHASPWHRSICAYYLLLVILRSITLRTEKSVHDREDDSAAERLRSGTYLCCSILLLVLNLCLIGPIVLLVRQEKPVNMSMIPAIAMAVYAFYKITLASVNLAKRKKSENCLVRLLREINFIDALLSIAALQNTLVMVAGTGDKSTIMPLTAVSGGLIWLAVVVLSLRSLISGIRMYRHVRG